MSDNHGTIVDVLVGLNDEALARVWVDLNRWTWPRDLPADLKPYWWDGHQALDARELSNRKSGLNDVLMPYAMSRVGEDAIEVAWANATGVPAP